MIERKENKRRGFEKAEDGDRRCISSFEDRI